MQALPPGWERFTTPDGRPYYFDRVTGVSYWTLPPRPAQPIQPFDAIPPALPPRPPPPQPQSASILPLNSLVPVPLQSTTSTTVTQQQPQQRPPSPHHLVPTAPPLPSPFVSPNNSSQLLPTLAPPPPNHFAQNPVANDFIRTSTMHPAGVPPSMSYYPAPSATTVPPIDGRTSAALHIIAPLISNGPVANSGTLATTNLNTQLPRPQQQLQNPQQQQQQQQQISGIMDPIAPISSTPNGPTITTTTYGGSVDNPTSSTLSPQRLSLLEQKASLGDAISLLTLGRYYRQQSDSFLAARHLRRAASYRINGALLELALMYLSGEGYVAEGIDIVRMMMEKEFDDGIEAFVLGILLRMEISGLGKMEEIRQAKNCERFAKAVGIEERLREWVALDAGDGNSDWTRRKRVDGLYLYGMAIARGLAVDRELDEGPSEETGQSALIWLDQAAERGHADAMRALGDVVLDAAKDRDGAEEREEAFRLFERAARRESPAAQVLTADMIIKNAMLRHVDFDETKVPLEALRLYRKAALQGHRTGILRWAMALADGWDEHEDAGDIRYVMSLLSVAYRRDDPETRAVKGMFLLHGIGMDKDEEAAVTEFKTAAMDGCRCAMNQYGACLRDGVGTERDTALGLMWLDRGRNLGGSAARTGIDVSSCPGVGGRSTAAGSGSAPPVVPYSPSADT